MQAVLVLYALSGHGQLIHEFDQRERPVLRTVLKGHDLLNICPEPLVHVVHEPLDHTVEVEPGHP